MPNVTLNVRYSPQATYASSITFRGITWTFDRTCRISHFWDGSPCVVGPCVVTSVSPSPTGTGNGFRNGSMVNPPAYPGVDTYPPTAFDGRQSDLIFDESYAATYPLTLNPGDSLVSVESFDCAGYVDIVGHGLFINQTYIKRMGVLTCLGETPTALCFRPPYMGTNKPLYTVAGALTNLASLPTLAMPSNAPTIAQYESVFLGPWMVHLAHIFDRESHPAAQQPNYGREVAIAVGEALLRLCGPESLEEKKWLALGMTQIGIDTYHATLDNVHVLAQNGGNSTGRKAPIVFAAYALGVTGSWVLGGLDVSEDDSTYFGATYSETIASPWGSESPPYASTTTVNVMYRHDKDPVYHRWEHLDTSDWSLSPFPDNSSTDYYPWDKQTGYQLLVNPTYPMQALAIQLMGLRSVWNHEPFFDYSDRVMNQDAAADRATWTAQAVADGWNALDPAADWTTEITYSPFGEIGTYTTFGNSMWTLHRASV
jgi:hypothetical protein